MWAGALPQREMHLLKELVAELSLVWELVRCLYGLQAGLLWAVAFSL